MRKLFLLPALLLTLAAAAPAQTMSSTPTPPPATHWPAQSADYVARDFHFNDGQTLPELKLHCLTLGAPHRGPAALGNLLLLTTAMSSEA